MSEVNLYTVSKRQNAPFNFTQTQRCFWVQGLSWGVEGIGMVWCGMAWYGMIRHGTPWHGTAWCGTI